MYHLILIVGKIIGFLKTGRTVGGYNPAAPPLERSAGQHHGPCLRPHHFFKKISGTA